jgi:hypothetical protein
MMARNDRSEGKRRGSASSDLGRRWRDARQSPACTTDVIDEQVPWLEVMVEHAPGMVEVDDEDLGPVWAIEPAGLGPTGFAHVGCGYGPHKVACWMEF